MKGNVRHNSKPGPSTALISDQEESLVSYLFDMVEHGYPLTRAMVKA